RPFKAGSIKWLVGWSVTIHLGPVGAYLHLNSNAKENKVPGWKGWMVGTLLGPTHAWTVFPFTCGLTQLVGWSPGLSHTRLEPRRIVAHSHNQRQQLLLSFLRSPEAFNKNAARRQPHALRQIIEFLPLNCRRGIDQDPRLFPSLPPHLLEQRVEASLPPFFVISWFAVRQPSKMPDQLIPIGQSVFANRVAH